VIAQYDPAIDSFVLWTGLHEKDLATQVPGASWKPNYANSFIGRTGAWLIPATWPTFCATNGVFGWSLQPDPSYTEWGQNAWQTRYEPLRNMRFATDAPLTGPTADRLWPLQRAAVAAMAFAGRYLEMDDMGGGKTATTLAAIRLLAASHQPDDVFPVLIVCPNKVRRSWRKIALEDLGDGKGPLWEGLRLEILPKGKPQQRKLLARLTDPAVPADERPQVIITNWESLPGLSRHEKFGTIELTDKEKEPGPLNEIGWGTVVADEAHRAKDRTAKQTRALKAIAFGTPAVRTRAARFRFALTGTPVAENSAEAWSILNFLDEVSWPAYTRFVNRYSVVNMNYFGGQEIGGIRPETRDEFHLAFDPFGIRRLREQFDPFKPRVVKQTLTVPMETAQARAYKEMAKGMMADLDGGVLTATEAMHRSNRMFQLAQAYGKMSDRGRRDQVTGEAILDLQLANPSNKVKTMLELVEELGITAASGAGRQIVFGAQSRQLIALCEEALSKQKIGYCLIAGGLSDQEQDHYERLFEQGRVRVALCVLAAAREGINSLVGADTLVFLQKDDSNVVNSQFQGRVDRPGQRADSVTIMDVVSEGTMEEFDQKQRLAGKFNALQDITADARVLKEMLQFIGEPQ
jgi:SNF2 family DNA or RNA helicase